MNTQPIAIILIILIGLIWASQIAKRLLNHWQNKELEKINTKNDDNEYHIDVDVTENKVVLSVKNDDSSKKKVKDVNDIQNLNSKYTKNVYRDSKGRFKSNKEIE